MKQSELDSHLARLRTLGRDDALIEVKAWAHKSESKSFWETVSAFANSNGGIIVLGLEEPSFTPAPGFNAKDVEDRIRSGLNTSDQHAIRVEPVPDYSVELLKVDTQLCVVVTISPLTVNGPCFVKSKGVSNGSFKRVGDADQRLSALEVYELQHRFDKHASDREHVPGTDINDLDTSLTKAMESRLKRQHSRLDFDETNKWIKQKSIVTQDGELTLAGLMALGEYPQQFFPQLFIDVAVHPGKEKAPAGENTRFVDRVLCESNVATQVLDAIAAIRRNLRTRRVIEGSLGKDVLEIPETVLREALANAVMHRDYSAPFRDQNISVDIFLDRVEISSPGGLPGGKTTENLDDGQQIPRNSTLARLLQDVPLSHEYDGVLAESNGGGILTMINTMKSVGLPRPTFKVDIARVTVILQRFGLADGEVASWVKERLGDEFSIAEGAALVLAKDLGAVTAKDLKRQTGGDSGELQIMLDKLAQQGSLIESSQGVYALSSAGAQLTPAQQDVFDAVSNTEELSAQQVSDLTDRPISTVRAALRHLVEIGLITATAPPSSRKRAYRRT